MHGMLLSTHHGWGSKSIGTNIGTIDTALPSHSNAAWRVSIDTGDNRNRIRFLYNSVDGDPVSGRKGFTAQICYLIFKVIEISAAS